MLTLPVLVCDLPIYHLPVTWSGGVLGLQQLGPEGKELLDTVKSVIHFTFQNGWMDGGTVNTIRILGILLIKLHEHRTHDNSDQLTVRSLCGCCEVLMLGSELVRGRRPGVAAGVSDSVEDRGVPLPPFSSSTSCSALTWVLYIFDWWREQSAFKCCD